MCLNLTKSDEGVRMSQIKFDYVVSLKTQTT